MSSQDQATSFQYQPVDQAENIAAKRRLMETMRQLATAPLARLTEIIQASYHANAQVNAAHPLNEVSGLAAIEAQVWRPLRQALPDLERHEDIVAGGRYRDSAWIGCVGHYIGTFEQDWLGIPASRKVVAVRYGEGHAVRAGKIVTSYLFIDFLDLMRQAGFWPLAPSLGSEMRWLPPETRDGVILTPQSGAVSQRTIERVLQMHAGLAKYSGQTPTRAVLDEMEMAKHWHPNFMWMGPAGIGTTRGLKGFEDYHQIPFLVAFPDRAGTELGHFIRIGDGHYAVTGGWGYLQATHTGQNYLGLPPTGKRIRFRVMDFYRCDAETILENWIPWDIPHMLLQMGVDVFGRMRHQFRQHLPLCASDWLTGT